MAELWTEKYFPVDFGQFVGNSDIVRNVETWAKNWAEGKAQKPLFFFGQSGAGKTTLAHLASKLNGWELFELNASDFRSKEIVERIVGAAAFNSSFSGKKRLVLLDEVDGLQSQDRGGAGAILSILRESKNPVILTANDIFADKKLAPIRAESVLLEFKKINYLSIAKRLREILELEKKGFDEEVVKEIAKNCEGDFRSALLDVQTLSMDGEISLDSVKSFGERFRSQKIFKVMAKIFKGTDLADIRNAVFSSDVSNDLLLRWVEENIPRQYSGSDVSSAFDVFSRSDVFNGRIMRHQHYGFLKYSSDLMTLGVAFSRKKEYHSFVPYQFPLLLSRLARSTSLRELKKGLAQKIGEKTHSSVRRVLSSDLAFIQMCFESKEHAVELAAQFVFDEKEVAFLLGAKPDAKKVAVIIEEAKKLREQWFSPKFVQKHALENGSQQNVSLDESGKQTRLF